MIDFSKCFDLLTGHPPFKWQERLYERFLADDIPPACDIPTGLGKTSVIAIWLLALATKLLENSSKNSLPRRLVYVVDRRVIVDQATKEAEKVLKRLRALKRLSAMKETHEDLRQIFDVLKSISFLEDDKNIIALSTLRGEYADNREWMLDPSRPAIIVGTIDMIGSRLLFSAYGGGGESYKALQAGLLGQDALIVIDEAHLSPAFMQTLRAVRPFINRQDKKEIKRFNVMSLSATPAVEEGETFEPFTLEKDAPEDLTNEVAAPRLNAEKKIKWHGYKVSEEAKNEKNELGKKKTDEDFQADEMARVAAAYKDFPVSVLIFGKTVNLVKKIVDRLKRIEKIDDKQILLMVGGMRGYERDSLVDNPIFRQFSPYRKREEQDKAYFLVATSCAEVGVNLDADFAVCDLTAADSFIQRLGRVNRFGNFEKFLQNGLNEEHRQKILEITGGETSSIATVVFNRELNEQKPEAAATFQTLQNSANGNGLEASPLALRQVEFSENCYEPKPVCPPLDPARIDDWAMTSLQQNEFPRPLVSYWLRGVTENNVPETSLCWRSDFKEIIESEELTGNQKKDEAAQKRIEKGLIAAVKTVRVKSRECARETTGRAVEMIMAIAGNENLLEQKAVVISAGNKYEVCSIADFANLEEKKELFAKLMFATVVLPCEVGGLDNYGITVDSPEKVKPLKSDVVEKLREADKRNEWLRVLLVETDEGKVEARKISDEPYSFDNPYENFNDAVKKISCEDKRCIKEIKFKSSSETDDEEEKSNERRLAYFISRKSPEGYLPSEGAVDEELDASDDAENETASIGFGKNKSGKGGEVSLEKHSADVERFARELAEKLYLSVDFIEALKIAGRWHDRGKDRECWQKAVGNFKYPEKILAKSEQPWFGHNYNQYYRHEFGSLVEAEESDELRENPLRDLILHLIATHHGYARPHFPARAFDKDNPMPLNQEIAERAMLRFARLQTEYGWWQLAYLEAILKAADALASRYEAEGKI